MPIATIIIPCYNEEKRLAVKEYEQFLSKTSLKLLFVDDGSTDHTFMLLEQLTQAYPGQVGILRLNINMGKAEAVRRGILKAACSSPSEIVGFMDADLSTPFDEVVYFLDAFSDANIDFVFGSRISRIGARIKRFNHRHYFGRVVATLVSNYLKIPVYDSQCGAKFFHSNFALQLFRDPFVSRWLFDVEIFKRIALQGINVEECALELPLHTWIEKGGSKISLKDYIQLPLEFCKIVHHYVIKEHTIPAIQTSMQTTPNLKILSDKILYKTVKKE